MDEKNKGSEGRVFNFHDKVNYIEKQVINISGGTNYINTPNDMLEDDDPPAQAASAGQHDNAGQPTSAGEVDADGPLSPQEMVAMIEQTQKYWNSSRAWCVVYRIFSLHHYHGNESQFVRDMAQLPFSRKPSFPCNVDAVSKPLRKHPLLGPPERWAADGAPEHYVLLGIKLEEALARIRQA